MSGPLPAFLSPLTVPASWAYGRIIAARNARFDRGRGIQRIDLPVISVGNITTGGTGKTPMVAWIARRLIEARLEPVIAMRGYRARPGEMSDEQAEYRELLPDAHVVADANRAAALRAFLPAHPDVRCVILDDGFQHRQLHRDLDLALIDATAGTLADRLLLAGNLREPLDSLRRADAVIVTHSDSDISNLKSQISNLKPQIPNLKSQTSDLKSGIERHHGRPPLAWSRHRWSHLDRFVHVPRPEPQEVAWLRGKRVLTMLGIGNPQAMIQQLQAAGVSVAVNIPCGDHERYDRSRLAVARGLCGGCDAMVITGKDWVKIRNLIDWSTWPVPIVVPRLQIEVFEGEQALVDLVLNAVRAPRAGKPAR